MSPPEEFLGSAKSSGSVSESSGSSDSSGSSESSPFGILTITFMSTIARPLNLGVVFLGATAGQGHPGAAYVTLSAEDRDSWHWQYAVVDLDQAWRDGFLPGSAEVGILADWGGDPVPSYASFEAEYSLDPFHLAGVLDPGSAYPAATYQGRAVVTTLGVIWFDPPV